MKRAEILDTAKGYVTDDRQNTHGKPEDTFGNMAALWSAYLGIDITDADAAAMMILLKVARIKENPAHEDNWIDSAGYSACGGELATEPKDV